MKRERIAVSVGRHASLRIVSGLGTLGDLLARTGLDQLAPWPVVVRGERESAALGLALSGCVLVGPGQLLLPPAATQHFGPWVWPLMLLVYALAVTLAILIARPRLVIYNIDPESVRAVLVKLAGELDAGAQWAGDSLSLGGWRLDLRIESFAPMSTVSLVANGDQQSPTAWRRLEQSLCEALAGAPVRRGRRGEVLIAIGTLVLVWLAYRVAENPAATVQGMLDLVAP